MRSVHYLTWSCSALSFCFLFLVFNFTLPLFSQTVINRQGSSENESYIFQKRYSSEENEKFQSVNFVVGDQNDFYRFSDSVLPKEDLKRTGSLWPEVNRSRKEDSLSALDLVRKNRKFSLIDQ